VALLASAVSEGRWLEMIDHTHVQARIEVASWQDETSYSDLMRMMAEIGGAHRRAKPPAPARRPAKMWP